MKKIILIAFLSAFFWDANAQEYRPMAEFGTDTIAYLQYNFVDRMDQYVGQPLKKLVGDYELEPFRLDPLLTLPFAPGAGGISYVYGVSIKYLYPSDMRYRDQTGEKYGFLKMNLSPPHPDWEDVKSKRINREDREVAQILGDMVIEEIKLDLHPKKYDERGFVIE